MRPSHDDPSPREIERKLYDADQFLDGLFPQSESEVAETMAMFGTTPIQLPEHLRNAKAVLERIEQREPVAAKPSAFGKLVIMLRTEKKLSIEQLAQRTDLDVDDLRRIESESGNVASPLAVSVLANYFQLQLPKVIRLAGLARESRDPSQDGPLSVAACAKPNFDSLTPQERRLFHAFVKQLRQRG